MRRDATPAWDELLALLAPVHDQAVLFARRIARSAADGDDLFQEAVVRAGLKLATLRDRDRFRPWFHQVIVSLHRSRARRGFWRRLVSSDSPGAARQVAELAGDETADERAAAESAARALATLPAAQREAIVLFELQELSVEEIAEIQRSSPSAVKSRLSRGRERLRRHYAAAERPIPIQEECHE